MAEFSRLVITGQGQALISKMIAGKGNIEFTRICASDAQYDLSQLEELKEISGVKQANSITKITRTSENVVKVETAFDNMGVESGYYIRTLGLYADDPDIGEVLYAAAVESSGNCFMPPYSGRTVSGVYIKLITAVGNAENVFLEVDSAVFATVGDVESLRKQADSVKERVDMLEQKPEAKTLWSGRAHPGSTISFTIPKGLTDDTEVTLMIESYIRVGLYGEDGSGFIRRDYGTAPLLATMNMESYAKNRENYYRDYAYKSSLGEAARICTRINQNQDNTSSSGVPVVTLDILAQTATGTNVRTVTVKYNCTSEEVILSRISLYNPK
ncbi:phage tail protein [Lachnospiraceae bacterium 46-15]